MSEIVHSGYLQNYSKSIWTTKYVTLQDNSILQWYNTNTDKKPLRSIKLKKIKSNIVIGDKIETLPNRPPKSKSDYEHMIAVPNTNKRNSKFSFFKAEDDQDLKKWAIAIVKAIPKLQILAQMLTEIEKPNESGSTPMSVAAIPNYNVPPKNAFIPQQMYNYPNQQPMQQQTLQYAQSSPFPSAPQLFPSGYYPSPTNFPILPTGYYAHQPPQQSEYYPFSPGYFPSSGYPAQQQNYPLQQTAYPSALRHSSSSSNTSPPDYSLLPITSEKQSYPSQPTSSSPPTDDHKYDPTEPTSISSGCFGKIKKRIHGKDSKDSKGGMEELEKTGEKSKMKDKESLKMAVIAKLSV